MAGARQHFFPRFVNKGFSSKIQKNEYYTWVFTKDGIPYETNVRNIGLEKFFYGKPDESVVDEILTKQEVIFSEQLDQLRAFHSTCPLDGRFPSEFITHLIIRAKHLRESFQRAGSKVMDIVKRNLDSPEKFYHMLTNLVVNRPELIEQSLSEELDKKLPPGIPKHVKKMLIEFAKLSFIPHMLPNFSVEGHALFNQLFTKMIDEMPNITKGAHIKALSKGITPEKFFVKFDGFHWSLNVSPKHTFIFGDIGPVAMYEPSLEFKPFLFAKGELIQVFLPISDKHMIVGKANTNLPNPEFDEINEASASLSQYYFISSKNGQGEKKLSNIIASKSSNISVDEISDVEKMISKEWFGTRNN